MTKFLLIILTLLYLMIPTVIVAEEVGFGPDANTIEGQAVLAGLAAGYNPTDPQTGLARIIGRIVLTFLSLLGVIFISYTVYGGYLWMTAAGNEEKITKAKSILRQGIIGLVIILSAAAIYALVISIFTGGLDPVSITGGGGLAPPP